MRTIKQLTTLAALLAFGCQEDPAEEARENQQEAAGELAEGIAEAEAAARGENEITEELAGERAEEAAEEAYAELYQRVHGDPAPAVDRAIARIEPTRGNQARGEIRLHEMEDGIEVEVHLSNLQPGSVHGFHIHQRGDCSAPDGSSAGDHYAPEGHPHGLPPASPRHAGDLGNVTADADGNVELTRIYQGFTLDGEHYVLGRAVILHADEDVGTQPSGGAGDRLACGVIEPAGPGT